MTQPPRPPRPTPSALAALVAFVLPLLFLASCGMGWRSQFPVGAELYARADGRHYGRIVAFEGEHDFANNMGVQAAVLIELDGPADGSGHPRQIWASCDALSFSYVAGPKGGAAPAARGGEGK